MGNDRDELGSRMKALEKMSLRLHKVNAHSKPIYVRLDGRSFSTFTRGMDKPYDAGMHEWMAEVTAYLVEKTGATIGYTQSDEISLVWDIVPEESEMLFGGKVHKLLSVIPSMATAKFMSMLPEDLQVKLPHFDCRVVEMPDRESAGQMMLWRSVDARRNAIQMVAQSHYSSKKLFQKGTEEQLRMIEAADGKPFFDKYPAWFQNGTFIRRIVRERYLTDQEMAKIPPQHRPTGRVLRANYVRSYECLFEHSSPEDVIFGEV